MEFSILKRKLWRHKASRRETPTPPHLTYSSSIETRSAEPRLETKISLNFVPWESLDLGQGTEGHSNQTRGSLKLKRAKAEIQTTQKCLESRPPPPPRRFTHTLPLKGYFQQNRGHTCVLCIPPSQRNRSN